MGTPKHESPQPIQLGQPVPGDITPGAGEPPAEPGAKSGMQEGYCAAPQSLGVVVVSSQVESAKSLNDAETRRAFIGARVSDIVSVYKETHPTLSKSQEGQISSILTNLKKGGIQSIGDLLAFGKNLEAITSNIGQSKITLLASIVDACSPDGVLWEERPNMSSHVRLWDSPIDVPVVAMPSIPSKHVLHKLQAETTMTIDTLQRTHQNDLAVTLSGTTCYPGTYDVDPRPNYKLAEELHQDATQFIEDFYQTCRNSQ